MLGVLEHFGKTDVGRTRTGNEDSLFARSPVFVVADGMGGAQAGEVASRMAVEAFEPGLPDGAGPEERLVAPIVGANQRIHELSRSARELSGMGTTLAAALVGDDEVSIAHVGDSRAYRLRGGELERLTEDHSLVEELRRKGELSHEQAAVHPQRSIITRALGPEPEVAVETHTYPARADDVFLLCSDGLTSMLAEPEMADVLRSASSLRHAGQQLIGAANAAGGRDNITVVLFRLGELGADGGAAASATAQPTVDAPAAASERDSPATRERSPQGRGRVAVTPARGRPRRRHRRLAIGLTSLAVVLGLLGFAGYLATREVYFVGTNARGLVTAYRGLPYDLPAGIKLYEPLYVSGVPAADVPPQRRGTLLDHKLRSQSDVASLVDDLELGRLAAR